MSAKLERIPSRTGQSFRLLRWDKNLTEMTELTPDGPVRFHDGQGESWHFHQELELTLVTRGQGTRFTGDHIGTFTAGDLVLLGGRLPHYWHPLGSSAGISLQWSFPANHPFWAFPESAALSKLFADAAAGIHYSGGAAQAVQELLHRTIKAGSGERLGLFLQILFLLGEAPPADQRTLSRASILPGTKSPHLFDQVIRHLVANFRSRIALSDLLEITGMSKATFARTFQKQTGKTFSDFIFTLRLQAACQELTESRRPVVEIAFACGFSQLSLFNRMFRRSYGCSPTSYRKQAPDQSNLPSSVGS